MQEKDLIAVFGAENIERFGNANALLTQCNSIEQELNALDNELKKAFGVDLSVTDIMVACIAGVVCGSLDGIFKSYVPKEGSLKHRHKTRRTALDHQVPKPEGFKGNVQGLHRQIGPTHDLLRFKEALDLLQGKTNDFPLWGSTLSKQTGGQMHAGNMRLEDFIKAGGFKIPEDPKAELMHHLLIDFFTKTSLPIPGTTYLADKSEGLAKLMLFLYSKGANLKNVAGNAGSTLILHLIIKDYAILFKAIPEIELFQKMAAGDYSCIKECMHWKKVYEKSNEYHVMCTMAFSASFLLDTIISTTSKNYTGLLELNYISLLLFAKHLIRYLLNAKKQQQTILEKKKLLINRKNELQNQYYILVQDSLADAAAVDKIASSLDPTALLTEQKTVEDHVAKLTDLMQQRKDIIYEKDQTASES